MRVLWASNSPYNASGYGMQTAMVTPRIQGAGHDVAIASNYGVEGCTLSYPGPREAMPIFPKGGEAHSIQITGEHAEHWQADVIMTHYDAWVYELEHFKGRPWAPWFPVDCDELQTQVAEKVKHAAFRVTQTRHGQAACEAAGLSCEYVPAAYSEEWYKPVDGTAWREGAGIPEDAFLVAVVAANKGAPGAPSRKSFPQLFEGFKLFLAERPDAHLYVHTIMQGHLNLLELAERYEIQGNISFAHPYPLVAGLCSVQDMALIYSAADVLLSPSMGEGFGVPIIEAQACGTPVITGDWTAMSEITRTGVAIPKSEAIRYPVPHSGKVYGDMFIVRPEAVRDALVEAATWNHDPASVASAVGEYEINRVFDEHWVPVLSKLEAAITAPKPAPPRKNREARRADRKTPAKKMPKVTLEKQTTGSHMRALLTFAAGPHEELLEIALPSYAAFAERHGYDLLVGSLAEPCDRPPSWWKIPMLRKALTQYYEVLFLGADLVITDTSEDMLVPATAWQALVPHRNHTGEVPNCDVWLVRKPMLPLLNQAWQMTEYKDHGWWEQAAILDLMGYDVGTLPNRHVYSSDVYDKTHFLDDEWNVHRWCEQPARPRFMHATMYEDRAATMRAWAEQAALCAA